MLRSHAEQVLGAVYPEAVERAAAETGSSPARFLDECPYTLDPLLTVEFPEIET